MSIGLPRAGGWYRRPEYITFSGHCSGAAQDGAEREQIRESQADQGLTRLPHLEGEIGPTYTLAYTVAQVANVSGDVWGVVRTTRFSPITNGTMYANTLRFIQGAEIGNPCDGEQVSLWVPSPNHLIDA